MSKQNKLGKQKALLRSGRFKIRNASIRLTKIDRARRNHLRNALRSCGEEFAARLQEHYAKDPVPGNKVS